MFLAYQATITLIPRILGSMVYKNTLLSRGNHSKYLAITIMAIGIIEIAIAGIAEYSIFAILWAMAVFLFGIFIPLKETLINEIIDESNSEKWRATILSVDSLLSNIVQAFVCLGIAGFVTPDTAQKYFYIGGVMLIIVGFTFTLQSSLNSKHKISILES